jgi:hypothetical protein
MRVFLLATVATAAIGAIGASGALAAPANGAVIAGAAQAVSPAQEARLYCHRGRVFLHWGPCNKDLWRYPRSRWNG